MKCTPGADAIVAALRHLRANITYDKIPMCNQVHMPTDSSFTTRFVTDASNHGHDSASELYASAEFVEWLLARRLPTAQRWW